MIAPRFSNVFMIGIYRENTKPVEFNEISAETISELREIGDPGLHRVGFNKYMAIKLVAVICDALARLDIRYS